MAADNDPNCEWSWLNKTERFPTTNVTEEDNGPGVEETDPFEDDGDDDLEAGWPMARAIEEAVMVDVLDSAYRFWTQRRGQKARML